LWWSKYSGMERRTSLDPPLDPVCNDRMYSPSNLFYPSMNCST
jgi:hypothetical protein